MSEARTVGERLAVLEDNMEKLAVSERDMWTSIENMRRCVVSTNRDLRNMMDARFTKVDSDTKSILRWVATGVLGVLLSSTAFLFSKVMGWS